MAIPERLAQERRLVWTLQRAGGRVVPWDDLVREVYGDDGANRRTALAALVSRARTRGYKIGTIQGLGLIWMADPDLSVVASR